MKTTSSPTTRLGLAIAAVAVALFAVLLSHSSSLPLLHHTGKTVDGSFIKSVAPPAPRPNP